MTATKPQGPSPSRFTSLDGLRGSASVMVAASHFIIAYQIALLNGDSAASHFAGDAALSHTGAVLFYNPDLGVAIFFVLSGFVLAANVSRTAAGLVTLCIRRWIRLAPPILVSSCFAWLILRSGLNLCHPASLLTHSSWLRDEYIGANGSIPQLIHLAVQSVTSLLVCINQGSVLARHYNSNLWTMPVEFLGSVGLFTVYKLFLLPFVPKQAGRVICLTAISIYLWNTPFYGFSLGAWLYESNAMLRASTFRPLVQHSSLITGITGAASLGIGLILGGTPYQLDLPAGGLYPALALFINPFVMPVSAITVMHKSAAFLILAGILLCAPARALLESPPFQFLGRISFMMYLIQVPIICSLCAWMILNLSPLLGYNTACLLAAAAYIVSLTVLGHLSSRLVDQPAISASHRFVKTFKWPL